MIEFQKDLSETDKLERVNKFFSQRQVFFRSLTDFAHNLDMKIIANFVEEDSEL